MKDILRSLKDIYESFGATTQALAPFVNPVVGGPVSSTNHKELKEPEIKKDKLEAKKEHELDE